MSGDVHEELPDPDWADGFGAHLERLLVHDAVGTLQSDAAAHAGDGADDQSYGSQSLAPRFSLVYIT